MRTLLIAGNWKMNPANRAEAVALAEAVKSGVGQADERARRALSARGFSRRGRRGSGRHADRAGRAEHALGGRRARSPARSPARCWSTPAARM